MLFIKKHSAIRQFFTVLIMVMMSTYYNTLTGQNSFSWTVDKDTILAGQTFELTILLNKQASQTIKSAILDASGYKQIDNLIYFQDTVLMEPLADIELGYEENWQTSENDFVWSFQDSTISTDSKIILKGIIFNPGSYRLPAPKIITEGKDTLSSIQHFPLVHIILPDDIGMVDTLSLAPIKPLMEPPADYTQYMIWILILLIVFAVMYYYMKFKRNKSTADIPLAQEDIISTPIVTPYDEAIQALNELKSTEAWKDPDIKEFQSKITYILRQFIARQFNVPAHEMTTDDILASWHGRVFTERLKDPLSTLLNIADMVKFAKAHTSHDIQRQAIEDAILWINECQTKINAHE